MNHWSDPIRPPRTWMFVASASVIAGLTGLALGAVAGGVLYEVAGPPWAQLGYEFEGLDWALNGAILGGGAGLVATALIALAVRDDFRGRRRLGAVVGFLFLGTAGGLTTFPATAPFWVVPVVAVAAVAGAAGAFLGARLATLAFGRARG